MQQKVKRPYRLKKRLESQAQTRQRIVDATVKLHTTIGAARTTISGIAREAGVERLTVYQHFPNADDLFRACVSRGAELWPRPDPASLATIADPEQRLRTALRQFYAYYANPAAGREVVMRDLEAMPAWVGNWLAEQQRHMARVLSRGWQPCDEPRLRAALGHAIDFYTFRSLVRQQELSSEQAIELMVRLVKSVAEPAA